MDRGEAKEVRGPIFSRTYSRGMLSFRITLAIEDGGAAPRAAEQLGDLEHSTPLRDFEVGGMGDELLYTVDADEIAGAMEVADRALILLAAASIDADASVARVI